MRIGYFADGPWSHKAFDKLICDDSVAIKFIVPRADTNDLTLFNYAKQYSIDYIKSSNINSKYFIQNLEKYECDLFVSMSFNQIFKNIILGLPKIGTINCHAGKLPFYRGRNVINWALINDEKEFGITVHFVDEGIDTGDIIVQKTYPISDRDDYASVLLTAYEEAANLLYQTIKMLQVNDFKVIKQSSIHPVGFYCGKRVEGDEIIDWNSTSRSLFNFIRAICPPGPGATTKCRGEIVKIFSSNMIQDAPIYKGKPGQVLVRTDQGFLVKTEDSFIEVTQINTKQKIRVGDVFDWK
jgi:methionyl-tRNA formyltransferase